jgi:hypothetical protein
LMARIALDMSYLFWRIIIFGFFEMFATNDSDSKFWNSLRKMFLWFIVFAELNPIFTTKKGGLRSLRLGFQKYFYGINSMSYDNQKSYSKRLTASRSWFVSTQTSNLQ